MTKNLHIEHPEDAILTGDGSVIKWLAALSHVSVKIDGSPAVVWGINPENGKFFVGTKSVFNKVKIKIAYTPQDIVDYYGHSDELVEILLTCLDFLPRVHGVYQGDFIGFGGESAYKPNSVIYDFGENVQSSLIIAPHTVYTGETMKEMIASPLMGTMESTDDVLFVQPTVDSLPTQHTKALDCIIENYANATFLTAKQAKEVKPIINSFIRENKALTHDTLTLILGDDFLATLYLEIMSLKDVMMDNIIVYDGPTAFADGEPIVAEGFVRSNQFGTMKLVNRYQFSRINFNNCKFA